MNNEKIEGIGTIRGGDYSDIIVDGMGKLKGSVTARKIIVSGTFKSKGMLSAQELHVDGFARIFRDIKIKSLVIDGTLKLRHAEVNADRVQGNGLLTSTGAISADEINIRGCCSVKKLMGDRISIHSDFSTINKVVRRLSLLAYLYFGRRIHSDRSLIDQIECTDLSASRIKAKVIRVGNVELGRDCIVDRLYCDGNMAIDSSCRIKKIYSNNEVKEFNRKGRNGMANNTIKKILDLYKHATINEEEAELMLKSVFHTNPPCSQNTKILRDSTNSTTKDPLMLQANSSVSGQEGVGGSMTIPWEEDGKLRLVAYIGRKLMKRGEEGQTHLEFKYEGAALNVDCQASLICGDISGNASVGGSISCKDIGSNASSGGSITCNDIGGSVSAGGSVNRNS